MADAELERDDLYGDFQEEPSFDVSPEEFEAFRREVFLGLYNLWRAVESQQEQIKVLAEKLQGPAWTPPSPPAAAAEAPQGGGSLPAWVWALLAAGSWILGFLVRGLIR